MQKTICIHQVYGRLAVVIIAWCISQSILCGQDRRGALLTPGLVIETGAPTAVCNALVFSNKGDFLLAAGGDKVVRSWPMTQGRFDRDRARVFRWPIYREQRGTIYDMALSGDENQRFLAIGGYGLKTGSIAVIDRDTGEVVHGLTDPNDGNTISALTFLPSGDSIVYGTYEGTVRRWDFKAGPDHVRSLGRHGNAAVNQIRALACAAQDRLISLAQDGTVLEWNADGRSTPLPAFQLESISYATVSADRKWWAALGRRRSDKTWCIELRSTDAAQGKILPFSESNVANIMALDTHGTRLALGMQNVPKDYPHNPVNYYVYLYDVQKNAYITEGLPKPKFLLNALCFSPSGEYLAMAGGNDYELAVWNLAKSQPVDTIRSPGSSLWGAALASDPTLLGFRDQRNPKPAGFNDWGGGAWRIFDLKTRNWAKGARQQAFKPAPPLESIAGWRVETDLHDASIWYVVNGSSGVRHRLPLDRSMGETPICYTFLQPSRDQSVRLVVGHQWGMSLFTLPVDGAARRTRLFSGHQGEVRSVSVSADGKLLVSASRDQTISAWTLGDWPFQAELGANFVERKGELFVANVAEGSPAWEAGLTADDEIRRLAYGGVEVREGIAKWMEILGSPDPGRELYFEVRRAGKNDILKMITTVRQRPLWRFFPTRDGEWVLWRWRDFFYDCSTRGDDLIGWQINGDMNETPTFIRAEQVRQRFHRPEKLESILGKMQYHPDRIQLAELIQPQLSLKAAERPDGDWDVTVAAKMVDEGLVAEPQEVCLWLNDFKIHRWMRATIPFRQTIILPKDRLRMGQNLVAAQAYSKFGVRGDSHEQTIPGLSAGGKSRLFGLCVGITKYEKPWREVACCREDGEAMNEALSAQAKNGLFDDARIAFLPDNQASREAIIDHLNRVAHSVEPNDVFVLFMAGHGWTAQRNAEAREQDPESFAFVTPTFDVRKPLETGLSFIRRFETQQIAGPETLYDLLVQIPCRKVVLLDCCHSGSLGPKTNIIRQLIPEGVGPAILTACDKDEISWSIPQQGGHGAFTAAMLEAISRRFSQADTDQNQLIDAREMGEWAKKRVPQLIEDARPILKVNGLQDGMSQTPQVFFPSKQSAPGLFGLGS